MVETSGFFDNVNFQVVEINFFHKAVLGKARLAIALKVPDVTIQPLGLSQIEFQADLGEGMENFVGTGILCFIADYRILQQMIVFPVFPIIRNIKPTSLKIV